MNLLDWSPPQPADLIDLADPGALQFLLDRYGGSNPDVLQSILAQVFDAGARMTVIEYRYLDLSRPGFDAVLIPWLEGCGEGDCCHGTSIEVHARAPSSSC